MNITKWKHRRRCQVSLTLIAGLVCFTAVGQAPSSLNYPVPPIYFANESNIYLSPSVAGEVISYSITPASLPAGLSFDENTGVLSGLPTGATNGNNPVDYTITAHGNEGDVSTTLPLQVVNNFFDDNYQPVNFGGSDVTLMNGATGATISNSTTTTYGRSAGDVVVYKNVATFNGQSIDCIVTTMAVSNTTFTAYDMNDASGQNFSNNAPEFFSPQVSFTGNGGSMQFNFQFILAGSYNTSTQNGINVTLQNVEINTYDIDGTGQSGTEQTVEFGGFSNCERATNTTVLDPEYNSTTGLSSFTAGNPNNISSVTDQRTRVRVSYDNMSNFSIRMAGKSTAYFFLDFSAGTASWTPDDPETAPSLDLNTDLPGVNNSAEGCGTGLAFVPDGQANVISPSAGGPISKITVSYRAADILDGPDEKIVFDGAIGSGGTFQLNSNSSASFTLSGTNYNAAIASSGGLRTLTISRGDGSGSDNNNSISESQAQELLNALHYNNTGNAPTTGARRFTVNAITPAFKSPDAIFTATPNCVSISGNVYHDINGMTDSAVNGMGISDLYIVRTNPADGQVIDVQPVANDGTYSFGTVNPGQYALYLSTVAPASGDVFNAASFPDDYVPTGENLGGGLYDDHLADGKLLITVGTIGASNANFGIQIPPQAVDTSVTGIANPGGYNYYTISDGATPGLFNATDADGVIDSIVINDFPAGTNYIKIGDTIYTQSGSICPPLSNCIPWPGSVTVPYTNGHPATMIAIDPATDGDTTVSFTFNAWDNAGFETGVHNISVGFEGPATYHNVSGDVWHDINGNGIIDNSENSSDLPGSLYAILVQNTNTYSGTPVVYASAPIGADGSYEFNNVPKDNDYTVYLMNTGSGLTAGSALGTAPDMPAGWTGVSTNANGTVVLEHVNESYLQLEIAGLNTNVGGYDFGIEQTPVAADTVLPTAVNPQTANYYCIAENQLFAPVDNDGTIDSIVIYGFPANLEQYRFGQDVYTPADNGTITLPYKTDGTQICLNPEDGNVTVSFHYKAIDNAGVISDNESTASQGFAPEVNISGTVYDDNNGMTNGVDGVVKQDVPLTLYASDGTTVIATTTTAADGTYNFGNIAAGDYIIAVDPGNGYNNVSGPADGTPTDGRYAITTGNNDIADVNFGINQPPMANDDSINGQNPGEPATVINILNNDNDPNAGTLTPDGINLVIPDGADSITPNGFHVPNEGTWTLDNGDVTFTPDAGFTGDPTPIAYNVTDSAGLVSGEAIINIGYNAPVTVSGKVFDDHDGAAPDGIAPPVTTVTLLDDNRNQIASTTTDGDGSYSFDNIVPGTYIVEITVPSGYYNVGSTDAVTPKDGSTTVSVNNVPVSDVDFGIGAAPVSDPVVSTINQPEADAIITLDGSVGQGALVSGNDHEDGDYSGNAGSVYDPAGIRITSLPDNGTLLYNGNPVTIGDVITDPSQLSVQLSGAGYTSITFEYAYRDASGLESAPATYQLNWGSPLPITFGSFTASVMGTDNVLLKWTTYAEIDNKGFDIQRSQDGRTWKSIAFVNSKASAGNTNDTFSYDYIDIHPENGDNYYRLKQIDMNGKAAYSIISTIHINADQEIRVFPNPAKDKVHITVTDKSTVTGVTLTDACGKVLLNQQSYMDQIDLTQYAVGAYYLHIVMKDGHTQTFALNKM